MQPIPETSPQFSNAQLLLLKAFASNLTDDELRELQQKLTQILGRRLTAAADAWWDANNFTEADVERMLNTKMRAGRPDVQRKPAEL